MAKNANAKFYEVERSEDGKIVSVTILPQGGKIYELGSQFAGETTNGMSAIKAASQFFRFHEWDIKKSEVGLHVMTGADLDAWIGFNVAVVSSEYAGMRHAEIGTVSEPWMQINRANAHSVLVPFTPEWRNNRILIHGFVDAYLQGIGFKVRVVPFNTNGWFDKVLSTWEEPDDEKARKMRNAGYAEAQSRRYINALVVEKIKSGEIAPAPKKNVVPTLASITLTTIDGEVLELAKLEPQTVKVHDTRNNVFPIVWDGSERAVARFAQVSLAKGWTVELK